ncbi:MAG: hypothetical protein M1839_001738 [Geoglossum umbratile]|nr:MAG: hypothetical protein M1839_001738 [Geoglossum umbratile]
MRTFSTAPLAAIAAIFAFVSANDSIDGSLFVNDDGHGPGHSAAMAAVPMFHFGRPHGATPCYPEAAERDGVQADGSDTDLGIWANLGKGCAYAGDWNGAMSPGNPFPVYYTIKQCSPSEYRVSYNIYFKHDSGHTRDWEGVIVVWTLGDNNQWRRDRIMLGQHGRYSTKNWGDIQNTINGDGDHNDQDQRDRNHAKIYVGAFYHAIFDTRYTGIDIPNPAVPTTEFRSNDWWLLPDDSLVVPGSRIKPEWAWGKADTNPASLIDPNNPAKYICNAN